MCKSMHLLKPVCSFSFPYHMQSLREKFLLEVKQFSHAHTSSTAMAPFLPQDTTLQCPSEHLSSSRHTTAFSKELIYKSRSVLQYLHKDHSVHSTPNR